MQKRRKRCKQAISRTDLPTCVKKMQNYIKERQKNMKIEDVKELQEEEDVQETDASEEATAELSEEELAKKQEEDKELKY